MDRVKTLIDKAWRFFTNDTTKYYPERHYMRGPGPAWHAKYGKTPPATQDAPKYFDPSKKTVSA